MPFFYHEIIPQTFVRAGSNYKLSTHFEPVNIKPLDAPMFWRQEN